MKIILKTLLIVLCFVSVADMDAQIGSRRKFFHEFRVGVNSSEMDIKDANKDKEIKPGFHFGYVATYKFLEPLQLQSGIFLTKKGMKQSIEERTESAIGTDITITKTRYEVDANYVQVPLMLGLESNYNNVWTFNIHAGAYGAWGFKGETTRKGTITETIAEGYEPIITNIDEQTKTFTSNTLKKIDYGAIAGIGIIYDVYVFNVSYEYGLYNISQNEDMELTNRNLTLSLGIRF